MENNLNKKKVEKVFFFMKFDYFFPRKMIKEVISKGLQGLYPPFFTRIYICYTVIITIDMLIDNGFILDLIV